MGLTDRRRAIVLFGDSLTQRSFEPSGWGAALAHLYGRRCDVYNRGFGGYNTRWCRSMVGELFPAHETPLLATVLLGTNDAALFDVEPAAHVPLEEYEDNLTAIVTHVKKRCVHVIVLTPPCMDERQRLAFQKEKYGADALGALDRSNAVTERYARVATRVAERLDVPCVDLFEATRKACASSSSAKPSGLGVSRQDSVDPWAEPEVAASPTKRGDDETQTQAPDVFVDGVHFSAFGQELVFQALTERIRRTQTTVHAHAHTKEPGGDAVLSLDPESMDPDWPFGPALRGAPEAWRDAMVAHARRALVAPTLRAAETGSRISWRVDGSDTDAANASSAIRGLAALAAVAGVGVGVGYALGGIAARR